MTQVSQAVGNRRLLKLARFLRTIPRKRFDYSNWVGENWKGSQDLKCGTTGCALGWAVTMPEFRRLGLRLLTGGTLKGFPIHGARIGSDAAKSIFALSGLEAELLFIPRTMEEFEASPKYVARKIEKFVKARS